MNTFLFNDIIFGPVNSRRLGKSLGVNLLPTTSKYCNFNCIYCECGWTKNRKSKVESTESEELCKATSKFHNVDTVITELENVLIKFSNENEHIDVITFAGNGEPTLHPKFSEIIDKTILLRNKYCSNVKIAVLSNSTMLHNNLVFNSLIKIDLPILKLDSGIESTIISINQPIGKFSITQLIENLKKFKGNFHLQTMFLRGNYNGKIIDNTTKSEVSAWLNLIQKVKPKQVMIYSIARNTPADDIKPVSIDELSIIAKQVMKLGIEVLITP